MTTQRDQEEQDARILLMTSQNELFRQQHRWETLKALAAIGASVAVMVGAILGLANYLSTRPTPTVTFPPGTVISIPK